VIVLVMLLISNVIFISKYLDERNDQEILKGDLGYFMKLKLRKQCDVFYYIVKYLENPMRYTSPVFKGEDEFYSYLEGIDFFFQDDMFAMFNEILFEDKPELKDTLSDLSVAIVMTEEIFENSSEEEKELLLDVYKHLEYLLNENNKENSLTYYMDLDKLDDPRLDKIIEEIQIDLEKLEQQYY